MAVGNHEFNYGLKNFDKARAEAKFAWLSANTKTIRRADESRSTLHREEVEASKSALSALLRRRSHVGEAGELQGYSFVKCPRRRKKSRCRAEVEAPRRSHSRARALGPRREVGGRKPAWPKTPPDSRRHPGVDAIVFRHTHNQVGEMRIGEVLLTQPKNWAISLSRMDVKLESKPDGGYESCRSPRAYSRDHRTSAPMSRSEHGRSVSRGARRSTSTPLSRKPSKPSTPAPAD
jgi:hypothetical protein